MSTMKSCILCNFPLDMTMCRAQGESMKLSDWLSENDKTLEWLAKEVGRHSSVMSRLANGHIRPSNAVAARIETLTRRKVTATDHELAFQARRQTKEPLRAAS